MASDWFWSRVQKGEGCWQWRGDRRRYGRLVCVTPKGKEVEVYRLAVLLSGVKIPAGSEVHHTCRNRDCVNPAHLVVLDKGAHRFLHGKMMPKDWPV